MSKRFTYWNSFSSVTPYVFDRSIRGDGVVSYLGNYSPVQSFSGSSSPTGSAMSVDFWMKVNSVSNDPIFAFGAHDATVSFGNYAYIQAYARNATTMRVRFGKNQSPSSASRQQYDVVSDANDGDWHLISFSREDIAGTSYVKIWVDAVLIVDDNFANGDITVRWSSGFVPLIFANYDGRRLDGEVADFCLRDRAMTDSEVADRYNSGNGADPISSGLVAHWKVTRPIGTTTGDILDISGNSNDIPMNSFSLPDGIVAASL